MYLFAFLYSVSVLFILVLHTICKNRVENKHEKKHENSMKTGMESSLKTDKNRQLRDTVPKIMLTKGSTRENLDLSNYCRLKNVNFQNCPR